MNFIQLILLFTLTTTNSFKKDQLRYSRVREAYTEKETIMKKLLSDKGIDNNTFQLYIRAFKFEKKIQLWAKDQKHTKYKLIKEYKVCKRSGNLGPKRQQGDLQTPEGFYFIDRFNPYSNYHLSLGINYPNASDKILGVKGNLGGDICIHGSCVTIGCLPITDDQIKELYIFCVEAKNNGQNKIPVHIFPARLSNKNTELLLNKYKNDTDKVNLWKALKLAYDSFKVSSTVPEVQFLSDGRHNINASSI
jgi:murein L,D-transpeptidase YafK